MEATATCRTSANSTQAVGSFFDSTLIRQTGIMCRACCCSHREVTGLFDRARMLPDFRPLSPWQDGIFHSFKLNCAHRPLSLVPTKFIHSPGLEPPDCPLLFQEKTRCNCCLQLRRRFCNTSAQLRRHWMVS